MIVGLIVSNKKKNQPSKQGKYKISNIKIKSEFCIICQALLVSVLSVVDRSKTLGLHLQNAYELRTKPKNSNL